MEDKEEKAALIASIPPIVCTVLENLSAKQLNKCALVCTLWRDIVKTIKKRRQRISWFFYYYCRGETATTPHCVPCYPRDQYQSCLASFVDHLNSLPCEPSMALLFCSKAMICRPDPYFPKLRTGKRKFDAEGLGETPQYDTVPYPVIGNLFPYFPKSCDVGFCTARGITGTSGDFSATKEIEFCPSLSVIYFPPLPGVKIYRFPLSGLRCTVPLVYPSHTGIPESTPVKCLLVFLYDRIGDFHCLPYNKLIGHYLDKQDWKLAVGGAYIDHMFYPKHKPRRRNQCYGLAFTGDNVEAASIVVTKDMKTERKIIQQLKLIADSDVLQGQCIAFMFTCVGRGTSYYENADFESSIFRKLFPHIPLFGVFGNGEVGINYIPNQEVEQKRKHGTWLESYASIFVFVSVRV